MEAGWRMDGVDGGGGSSIQSPDGNILANKNGSYTFKSPGHGWDWGRGPKPSLGGDFWFGLGNRGNSPVGTCQPHSEVSAKQEMLEPCFLVEKTLEVLGHNLFISWFRNHPFFNQRFIIIRKEPPFFKWLTSREMSSIKK